MCLFGFWEICLYCQSFTQAVQNPCLKQLVVAGFALSEGLTQQSQPSACIALSQVDVAEVFQMTRYIVFGVEFSVQGQRLLILCFRLRKCPLTFKNPGNVSRGQCNAVLVIQFLEPC